MIRIDNVAIQQGDFRMEELNLTLPDQCYAILMGPTGCGKTTLVEAICGLRPVSRGSIHLGQTDITRHAPFDRNVGYVPQDSVLFPTMRIDQQIEFALVVRKMPRNDRRKRVAELAELLGIGNILERFPQGLSGGERQRVALARALAFRPRLLCLDEPLAALDANTKSQITALLKRVHRQEKVNVLHITHSPTEAVELGTLVFQMVDQQIIQTAL
ncbi:MAG: ATP-binding cassette domain-containing protein [Planctomycetota bacterium]|nr:ATP-binding cassette domain-containing protein [Planctomycetota bacterium]